MSSALDALASLYRRKDVDALRLVATEASLLADMIAKRSVSARQVEAPRSARSEKASKAAQARWGNAPSNAQSMLQASVEQCSNDAPSMPQASDHACSEHAVEGVGGGLSLGISGSSLPFSDPEENTKNPPTPRRRRNAECDAPPAADVVDETMQRLALAEHLPDPFAAYKALVDNYLSKGKRAVGVDGWKAALRGWLRRNLDKLSPWIPDWETHQRLGLPTVTNHSEPVTMFPRVELDPDAQQDLSLTLSALDRHLGAA